MEFETLFQCTRMMLLEDHINFIFFLIPCLLLFAVPKRVDDILQFIEDYTVHVEGCDLCLDDFDAQLQLLNAGIN